ncbi:MAG: alkaline phosphatase family protein [Candidatus Heimdallarchaeota archaeon]
MQSPLDKFSLKKFRKNLYEPDFEKSICGVMPTAFELLGLSVPAMMARYSFSKFKEGKTAILKNILNLSDSPRYIINVLIDSWGVGNLSSNIESDYDKLFFALNGFLISSVFPTITSSAVASWHMGVPPSEHGLLGHKIFFEEIGNVVDTLNLRTVTGQGGRDSLVRVGLRPKKWLWSPSLYNELEQSDVLHIELLSRELARTGLSHFLHSNETSTIVIGCNDLIDIFATARELIVRINKRKNMLMNIYLGEFDWLAHKFGPQSPEGTEGLKHIIDALKWFLFSLPKFLLKETVLTLSADHGQVDTTRMPPVSFSRSQQEFLIQKMLCSIPGRSGRLTHFYVKPEKKEDLITYLENVVDARGAIISVDDAHSLLNVNSVSDQIRSRVGDILVLLDPGTQFAFESKSEDSFVSSEIDDDLADFPMKGSHGSLSFQELVVPCIVSLGTLMKEELFPHHI